MYDERAFGEHGLALASIFVSYLRSITSTAWSFFLER